MEKLSVIVPTYKRPRLIARCMDALLSQNFPQANYEIIIVSDGPDPETHDLVNHYRTNGHSHLHFLSLGARSGPAAARNLGWRYATGTLIAFTDDDCIPDKNWLFSFWKSFEDSDKPELAAYTGSIQVPLSVPPTDFELNTAHLESACFVTANCACTRKALEMAGGFDEHFKLAWREDSDLEFRLLEANVPILKSVNAWIIHPARKAKWGISMYEQKKVMFDALLYRKYPSLYKMKIRSAPAWNYYGILFGFILLISGILVQSNFLFIAGSSTYLFLTIRFIVKRLARTSRSLRHVTEMIITSVFIPFLSIYWTIYGAVKYRVLFL